MKIGMARKLLKKYKITLVIADWSLDELWLEFARLAVLFR